MNRNQRLMRLIPLVIGVAALATSAQAGGDKKKHHEEEAHEFEEAQL